MPYTGLLSWHIMERVGQFHSRSGDRKCKLDYLIKYMTILVENVESSVFKNKAGELFPSSEFSHKALWKLSTQPASGLENWGLTVALSWLFQIFTLSPVTQYIHSLPWNCEMPSNHWLWDLAHGMSHITDRTEICLLGWAHMLSTSAIGMRAYLGYPLGPVGW